MNLLSFLDKEKIFNRYAWIDFSKGILIVSVVYIHVLSGLQTAGVVFPSIYSDVAILMGTIRMPLFFMMSGIFIRGTLMKRSVKDFVVIKLRALMYPYFLWSFIQVTLQVVFSHYAHASRGLNDYLYIFYQPRIIGHFWFIYALFSIAMFYLLLFNLFKGNKWAMFSVALAMYIVYPFVKIHVVEDVFIYFIYFYIGDLISSYICTTANHEKIASWGFTITLLPLYVLGIWRLVATVEMNYIEVAVVSVLGSFLTLNLAFKVAAHRFSKSIRIIGYHSMYIYILHVMVSGVVRSVFIRIFHIENGYLLLTLIITSCVIIPILFYNLTKRKAYFLFTLDKPTP